MTLPPGKPRETAGNHQLAAHSWRICAQPDQPSQTRRQNRESAGRLERTNRQVTFEYVLLAGVNDAPEHARELAALLAPLRQLCHVNLIPVNKTAASYAVPSGEAIRAFRETLRAGGVSNSVRAERGDDIASACGQLSTHERRTRAPSVTPGSA